MCFAGAVYTYQGQWRDKSIQLQNELSVARQNTEDQISARARETKTLTDARKEAEAARDNAVAELDEARLQAQTAQAQLAAVMLERDKAMADAQVATTEASARVAESTAQKKEADSLRDRITELRRELQQKEDDNLDAQGRLADAREMEEQLLGETARLKDLLRINDIDPRTAIPVGTATMQVEKIDGLVKESRRNLNRTQELVEITVGSDDGIREGMNVTIYRDAKFICQARVMTVYPDVAICVVKEQTREGEIQEGDNVTTKL
jgi:predicted RNase H-like nuclease (RuvC/YqgF family)